MENPHQFKYCNACEEIKPNDEFYKYSSYCKLCCNKKTNKYYQINKEKKTTHCQCGRKVNIYSLNTHLQTKIHEKNMKIIKFIQENKVKEKL